MFMAFHGIGANSPRHPSDPNSQHVFLCARASQPGKVQKKPEQIWTYLDLLGPDMPMTTSSIHEQQRKFRPIYATLMFNVDVAIFCIAMLDKKMVVS